MPVKQNNKPLLVLAICICIAYLLPYHVHPFRAFYNDWIVILGVAMTLAFYAERNSTIISIPKIALIPAGLAILICAQVVAGKLTEAWDAILPIAYFVCAAVACVLGATIGSEKQGAYRLCNALAVAHLYAAILSVGIASLQFVDAEGRYGAFIVPMVTHDNGIRPFANVAQPNQLALLFCFAFSAVWWLFQVGRIGRSISFVTVIFLLWGLALTQSRIGWLIVPAIAFFVWLWRGKKDFARVPGWAIVTLVFIYVTLILNLSDIAATLGITSGSVSDRIGTRSERLVLMSQALHASLDNPFFGAGWYEFGPMQLEIGADFPKSIYAQHAHNIVLNFAVEVGWPVTLAVFVLLAYWFFAVCCFRRISKEVGFAALFLVAVFIHSLVEFPLWYAYVLLPTALLLGMAHQEQLGSWIVHLSRTYVAMFCLVVSVGLVTVAVDYRRVVVGFRALGFYSLGLDPDTAAMQKPEFTLFPHFYDYFQFAKTAARRGMSANEIAYMERVARRFGYAPVLMRMSLIYAVNGRQEDAYRSLMTINRLHPGHYAEAYQGWEKMAQTDSDSYEQIFRRLPAPEKIDIN